MMGLSVLTISLAGCCCVRATAHRWQSMAFQDCDRVQHTVPRSQAQQLYAVQYTRLLLFISFVATTAVIEMCLRMRSKLNETHKEKDTAAVCYRVLLYRLCNQLKASETRLSNNYVCRSYFAFFFFFSFRRNTQKRTARGSEERGELLYYFLPSFVYAQFLELLQRKISKFVLYSSDFSSFFSGAAGGGRSLSSTLGFFSLIFFTILPFCRPTTVYIPLSLSMQHCNQAE